MNLKLNRPRISVLAVFILGVSMSPQLIEASPPRVLVVLNPCLSCENPDDIHALVHLLWHSDRVEIEGIFSDTYDSLGQAYGLEAIDYVLDSYERDYENSEINLAQRGFPAADRLRESVSPTFGEAIERIRELAHRDPESPLYVLNLGNLSLMKESLTRDPVIASRIRLISVAGRSNYYNCRETNLNGWGRDTIFRDPRFNEMWWLEMDWTQEAIHRGEEPFQLLEVLSQYGNLGRVLREEGAETGFRGGDAVPLLYLMDPEGTTEDPSGTNWIGSFPRPFPEKRPRYYTDDMGPYEWDFEKPCRTWIDRELARAYSQRTLLQNRSRIYSVLLEKLNSIYPTQTRSETLASYEAEDADFSDGLEVKSDFRANHGFYVEMKGNGSLTWVLADVPSDGTYSLTIRYKLPFLHKSQRLLVNGEEIGTIKFDGEPRIWREKEIPLYLREGRNTVTVEKDWGYMDFDTATLILGHP